MGGELHPSQVLQLIRAAPAAPTGDTVRLKLGILLGLAGVSPVSFSAVDVAYATTGLNSIKADIITIGGALIGLVLAVYAVMFIYTRFFRG